MVPKPNVENPVGMARLGMTQRRLRSTRLGTKLRTGFDGELGIEVFRRTVCVQSIERWTETTLKALNSSQNLRAPNQSKSRHSYRPITETCRNAN